MDKETLKRGTPQKNGRARHVGVSLSMLDSVAGLWRVTLVVLQRLQSERGLPELRPLGSLSQDLYRLLDDSKTLRVARWRSTWLRYDPKYQVVLRCSSKPFSFHCSNAWTRSICAC